MTEHPAVIRKSLTWPILSLLVIGFLLSIGFFFVFALPYLLPESTHLDAFNGREFWLISHILSGSIAIFLGAPQLWMGLTGRTGPLHRKLGWLYLGTIAFSSVTTFYLAVNTTNGWLVGMGLGGLGLAWVLTSSLALISILKKNFVQHMEWMIRSYVVTLGFVFFRLFLGFTIMLEIGTMPERLIGASWICWALPLLLTEVCLQGRKVLCSSGGAPGS